MENTQYELVAIKDIVIDPDRFRKEYVEIDELADSIKHYGLIYPLVLDKNNKLVIGGRRIRACEKAGMTQVPVVRVDIELLRALELEFEENAQRDNFTWQEKSMAIKRIHELRLAVMGQASAKSSAAGVEGHSLKKLGEELNRTKGALSVDLHLAEAMVKHPEIKKAKTRKEAIKQMMDIRESALIKELQSRSAKNLETKELKQKIYNVDCIQFMRNTEERFDIIITDPPYGIDIEESMGIDVAFDDSQSAWLQLINTAIDEITKVTKPNAHLYMFHAPDGWSTIKNRLLLKGWSVDPKPIIWVRNIADGAVYGGRVCNADRRFAMAYEMITFAVKGTKALQKEGKPNVILMPGLKGSEKMHPTEKPEALIKLFLEYSALPTDKIFDPFAGSGVTLTSAHQLKLEAVGTELDKGYFTAALHRVSLL